MAIVKRGSMLEDLRGRVGDLVFREVDGRTVVSRRPSGRREEVRSAGRQRALTRFQEAVRFAQEARHRPAYRSLSRALRAHSPYHVALQDYLSVPVVEGVDARGVGPSGGQLVIRVSERVAIRSVRVKMAGRSAAVPESVATSAPSPAPPSAPPAAAPQRAPIPAAVFFKRVPRLERPGPPAPPRETPPAVLPLEPALLSEEREVGPVDLQATRRLGLQGRAANPGEANEEGRVEVWCVALPRPGEVEILAADYAGNHAARTFRVGLPGSDLD